MQAAGRSVKWILGVWGTVAVSTVVLIGAVFLVAGSLSQSLTAALQLFGAGAMDMPPRLSISVSWPTQSGPRKKL
jgi:hypothetical protein